ncbi:hypothetical protein EST38_g6624 [Candolleomyces aberdarensis]|uniref:Uncharacterized protein n=1 Tax=Candolleomyces aberdarensis TaxID=2316362 RepID=A0A4Q2DHN8_9AGAR|nr:hypothetical protein EST38_g6624 [Candolleomyces aberdarensis]
MSGTSAPVSPSDPSGPSQNDPVPDLDFDYVDEGAEWSDKPPTNRDGRGEVDKKIKGVIIDKDGKKIKKQEK